MNDSQSERPSRRRYHPRVVKSVLSLQRLLLRLRVTDLIYFITAFPLAFLIVSSILLFNRVEIRGLENLPDRKTGFFLLSNHISTAEAPTIAAYLFPRPFWFPSKAEFYKGWVSGIGYLLVTALHTFPVRRGERDRSSISLMEDLLRQGQSVLLFPEGTRSRTGDLLPGKKGVGMIIHSVRPPVIPVYVEGFQHIWPAGSLLPRFGGRDALISFGPLVDLTRWWDEEFNKSTAQGIVDDVMGAIADLRDAAHAEEGGRASVSSPPKPGE